MAAQQPQKMNWWYQSIIEWMIENPDQPLRQCAQDMGVSQPWLSCIINSDAFRLAYSEARGEHFEATSHHVIKKMEGIAMQSADLIAERLEEDGDRLSITQLNSTAELALKALGYTSSHGRGPAQAVQVNVSNELGVRVAVDRDTLAVSRERMRQLSAPAPSASPLTLPGPDGSDASSSESTSEGKPIKVPTTS